MSLGASRPFREVGRYRVYSELASGGMATVHLGCLLGAGGFSKLVAIKSLHEELSAEESFVAMFLDEARLASSIHHPNVVASLDVVAEKGEVFVVMEYVHGETLAGLMRAARQAKELAPVSVIARIVCDALEGLHAAHSASLAGKLLDIVHRDVSPQNIMVGADGNTRVLDFGIAQAALRSHITAIGTVKGKIAYMSPEQAQGHSVDARTDVFAAGVVLWEALTGRRLFFAPDSRDAMELLLLSTIPAPSSIVPSLPPALDAVVLRALERDRERRFSTAREFAEALRAAVDEGSRKEVAEWVARLAQDGLNQRLALLQALEASALHGAHDSAAVHVAPSSPRAAPGPVSPEQTQAQVTVTTSVLPSSERVRTWHKKAAWWVALAGVATALASWLLLRAAPVPEARVAAPSLPAAVGSAAHVAPPKPAAVASETAPVVGVDQLPPVEVSAPTAVTRRPAVREASAASAAKRSCSPPYRIDAAGVRRVKPECL